MSTSPHREFDSFLFVCEEECGDPVMTIRNAEGGVMLDYCHDRTGERVIFIDKPKCATEAVVNRFGWNFEFGDTVYVPYDALGEFLATRIKNYFGQADLQRKPLQIAPIIEFLTPENHPECGSFGVVGIGGKRPTPFIDEIGQPRIKDLIRHRMKALLGFFNWGQGGESPNVKLTGDARLYAQRPATGGSGVERRVRSEPHD